MQLDKLGVDDNVKLEVLGEGVAAEHSFKILRSDNFSEYLIIKYDIDKIYYGIRVDDLAQTVLRKVRETKNED